MSTSYKRITTKILQEMKNNGEKIGMLTSYDYTLAKIVDDEVPIFDKISPSSLIKIFLNV